MLLLLAAAFFALFYGAMRLSRRRGEAALGRLGSQGDRLLSIAAVLALVALLIAVLLYGLQASYNDHLEPSVAALSWIAFERGQPLYHDLDSASLYRLIYGPALFWMNWVFMKVLGASILSSKLCGMIAGLASLPLVFLACRRLVGARAALLYAGLMAATCLTFGHASFWNRGDAHLLFLVALALLAATGRWRLLAVVLVALAIGLGVDVKVHAILYFLPALVLLRSSHGTRALVLAGLLSALVAALPFLVFPQVSLANYAALLGLAARHGLDGGIFLQNLELAAFLAIPALPFFARLERRDRPLAGAVLLCVLPTLVLAAKPGAGVRHLIPLLPVLLLLSARSARTLQLVEGRTRSPLVLCAALALFAASGLEAMRVQYGPTRHALDDLRRAVADDIESVLRDHPGATVGMGYGSLEDRPYSLTGYRPILAFHGQPCLVDSAAVMDLEKAGLAIPQGTLDALRSGAIDIWLVPKGERPFSLRSYYHDPKDEAARLFGKEFAKVFLESYAKIGESRYFDLWRHILR